jgi:16S rRNA (uracil1498-N3)-methyltransferase
LSQSGPDERLRRADAFVFVAKLDAPCCEEAEAHHLLDVLRLPTGAVVAAGDGAGRFRLCRLGACDDKSRGRRARSVILEPISPIVTQPASTQPVTVAFSLLKGDRFEWAVQKLTELGVDRIVPLLTTRTIVRLAPNELSRRAQRLRRVAREAASQARRTHLPQIAEPINLEGFLAAQTGDVALAEPGGGPLAPETRCVVVGPEGGWSDDELARIPTRVGLGNTILRAETAALAAGVLLTLARASSL